MKNQSVLIKVSGDLYRSPRFFAKLKTIHSNSVRLAICVGGGTQINEALSQTGFKMKKHGPLGRELETNEERQTAKEVLSKNRAELQQYLNAGALRADVIIPVFDVGGIICHVNGDQFVKTLYHGFDKIYVFTMKTRVVRKAKEFKNLPKVRVVGL